MAASTRLFVGNLPETFSENTLREAFSSYGDITNLDLKSKPGLESDKKLFAFITISASNVNVESCIKNFANEDFHGNRLYVTRARESFLERLQRERDQAQKKENEQVEKTQSNTYAEKNIRHGQGINNKRKFIEDQEEDNYIQKKNLTSPEKSNFSNFDNDGKIKKSKKPISKPQHGDYNQGINNLNENDYKKLNSDQKRLESMKKKRQEFKEKKNIIKSGLISIDSKPNKKVLFPDSEEHVENNFVPNIENMQVTNKKAKLFEDEASDEEINFEIKKQYEGKKGQKVLNLQSRYKSDKRFVLDERFIEEETASEKEDNGDNQELIEIGQANEKSKQLDILQDVLGVTIKSRSNENTNKTKAKIGMLRFDPSQPEHAKYLAPIEVKQQSTKKSKKKNSKDKEQNEEEIIQKPEPVVEKVEVSKEQFYKISDTLKEAISQPNTFSLRSLFQKDNSVQEEVQEEDNSHIPFQNKKDKKIKNPLEPGEKNPFVYDSSESENEDNDGSVKFVEEKSEPKMVWREKLFFSSADNRLKDGLLFFSKTNENSAQKERRELKSVVKKRIYNKERKNTMFQKKIGGRKKTLKKKFKKS